MSVGSESLSCQFTLDYINFGWELVPGIDKEEFFIGSFARVGYSVTNFWPILETGVHFFFFDTEARSGLIRLARYEHTESHVHMLQWHVKSFVNTRLFAS